MAQLDHLKGPIAQSRPRQTQQESIFGAYVHDLGLA